MNTIIRTANIAILTISFVGGLMAQRTSSVTQVVTFSVKRTAPVAVVMQMTDVTLANAKSPEIAGSVSLVLDQKEMASNKLTVAMGSDLPDATIEMDMRTSSGSSAKHLLSSFSNELPFNSRIDLHYRVVNAVGSTSSLAGSVIYTVTD